MGRTLFTFYIKEGGVSFTFFLEAESEFFFRYWVVGSGYWVVVR